MNPTESGRNAEQLVAKLLKSKKHKIQAMNWRTRRCEIDIVSIHKKTVYFTEVKFRSSKDWGDGLSYITPKKYKQMHFAAEMWISENNWSGEAQLLAASVDIKSHIELVEV